MTERNHVVMAQPRRGRLHCIAAQLRQSGTQAEVAAVVDGAPEEQSELQLLTEAQMQQYLSTGFLVLNVTEVPEATHERIYRQCHQIAAENPGNDILAAVPELQRIFDSSTVAGALRSVLKGRSTRCTGIGTCTPRAWPGTRWAERARSVLL